MGVKQHRQRSSSWGEGVNYIVLVLCTYIHTVQQRTGQRESHGQEVSHFLACYRCVKEGAQQEEDPFLLSLHHQLMPFPLSSLHDPNYSNSQSHEKLHRSFSFSQYHGQGLITFE